LPQDTLSAHIAMALLATSDVLGQSESFGHFSKEHKPLVLSLETLAHQCWVQDQFFPEKPLRWNVAEVAMQWIDQLLISAENAVFADPTKGRHQSFRGPIALTADCRAGTWQQSTVGSLTGTEAPKLINQVKPKRRVHFKMQLDGEVHVNVIRVAAISKEAKKRAECETKAIEAKKIEAAFGQCVMGVSPAWARQMYYELEDPQGYLQYFASRALLGDSEVVPLRHGLKMCIVFVRGVI